MDSVRPAISISVGVAAHPSDTRDVLELVAKSDLSLLTAKRLGRNRVMGNGLLPVQESRISPLAH
jgi:GGDEF domain-containing protein